VIAATRGVRVDTARWRYIVAHHSAVEAGNAKTYGAEHGRRGYEHGLAYHFVIGNGNDSGDGEIEVGSRWIHQLRGGHVRDEDVNNTGLGICLVGNLQNHPPTDRQVAAMTSLIDWLRGEQNLARAKFTVHRWVDRNHTVCPGRHFPYAAMKRRYG
jgi:N-acetyl-anhydromuramyl-L-alanine amidase AmpD